MSSKEWNPLPVGTTAASHKPRFPASGWQAEQDALREAAERKHYRLVEEQDEFERRALGNVTRVQR